MVKAFRILLIEDDTADAMWARRSLQEDTESSKGSFVLKEAQTLAEGLELLRKEKWDAILLDLSLPDSSWDETFSKFYMRSGMLPIIILTGVSDRVLAEDCVANGAANYLVKGETDGPTLRKALLDVVKHR